MNKYSILLVALTLAPALSAQNIQDMMNKAMQKPASSTQGSGEQVTIEENTDPYTPLGFTGSYRMEVHSYKNGTEEKDSPMFVRMGFNDDHLAMIPEQTKEKGEVRMVYDLRNRHTYTLITDQKGQRTGMKMKMMKVNVEGTTESDTDAKVERTDETKVIDGHTCRKYTMTSSDGNGEAWVAEDVDLDMMKVFGQMVGGKKPQTWQRAIYRGLAMETTWNDAKGKEKVMMYTRDLVVGKVDESLFSTSGYEIQDMTSMPMFGQ